MAKYVVKNERGEYLCQSVNGVFWCDDTNEDVRAWRFAHFAFKHAKRHGAKVYRVRKVTAKRERARIVEFIDGIAEKCEGDLRWNLQMLASRVGMLEHRRKRC